MPIRNYGVVKGAVRDFTPGSDSFTHFQVILDDNNGVAFQVDINVRSQDGSELLYYADSNYSHPLLARLSTNLATGYTPLQSEPGSLAIDFLRSNLFDTSQMVPLGMESPVKDNLNTFIGQVISQSAQTQNSEVYVFGQFFQDRGYQRTRDARRGLPAHGIHDIHMNQGNFGHFAQDNGVYQDGGMFIHFPTQNQWTAIFLAFQSQAFTTDENGNPSAPSWAKLHGGEVYGRNE
jgi:uncharacterized protein YukJ